MQGGGATREPRQGESSELLVYVVFIFELMKLTLAQLGSYS